MQDSSEVVDVMASLKGFNPKEIKKSASEIIKAGAALYDALGHEPELREHRARAVAGHVDTDFVERSIREAIAMVGIIATPDSPCTGHWALNYRLQGHVEPGRVGSAQLRSQQPALSSEVVWQRGTMKPIAVEGFVRAAILLGTAWICI